MSKHRFFMAITAICGLATWGVVLQIRLAQRDSELSQLEAKYQGLATQQRRVREHIESSQPELLLRRTEMGGSAGSRRGNLSGTKALSDEADGPRAPAGAPASAARWDFPPELSSAITQRFDPAEIHEIQSSIQKGRQVYIVRGMTADGRSFGAMMAPDGTVLSSKSEVAPDTLPVSVTSAFREIGGEAAVEKAREVYGSDGHVDYALSGQAQDGRKVTLNISADGQCSSGEIERSAGDLPEPVGRTLAQTVANRSPSSVLEVFGEKGNFFEIGLGDDTEHIHLVIDDQGRLLSFSSKANLDSGQSATKP